MKNILSLGWVASIIFILSSLILGALLNDYNSISQTVSEIGKVGSHFYVHWQIVTVGVGSLFLVFALGIFSFTKQNNLSITPSFFLISYGVSQLGVGIFPAPHTLHNLFGLSMMIGYFTPLVFALSWKNQLGITFKQISLGAFCLVILAIILNLTPAFAPTLYPLEYYGVVQRFLLFSFYLYCHYVSYQAANFSRSTQNTLVFNSK